MAVTDSEYAILSNAVYHDKNFINPENYGFRKIRDSQVDADGFYAEAYQRGNEVVIAYRGTNNPLNVLHDAQMLAGKQTIELKQAMSFYEKIKNQCEEANPPLSLVGMQKIH